MKVNPIYQKEMRMMWRSPVFILSVIGVNMILGLIALAFMAFMNETVNIWNPILEWMFHGNGVSQMSKEISYNSVRALYTLLAVVNFVLMMFLIPSMTASAITWERQQHTLDLLLTTQLSPSKIVVGKLLAIINIVFTLLFSTLPIFSLVFVYGRLQVRALLELLGVMLWLMIYVGSIGIFCSSFSTKSWRAAILDILVVAFLVVGSLAFVQSTHQIINTRTLNATGAILCLLLLLNPALSFLCLLQYQLGGAESFLYYLEEICHVSKDTFLATHWLWFSLVVQLLLAGVLVYASGQHLLPKYRNDEDVLRD